MSAFLFGSRLPRCIFGASPLFLFSSLFFGRYKRASRDFTVRGVTWRYRRPACRTFAPSPFLLLYIDPSSQAYRLWFFIIRCPDLSTKRAPEVFAAASPAPGSGLFALVLFLVYVLRCSTPLYRALGSCHACTSPYFTLSFEHAGRFPPVCSALGVPGWACRLGPRV